jgi:hypothetical protein
LGEMLGEGGHCRSRAGLEARRASVGCGSGRPTRQSARIEAEAKAACKWGRGGRVTVKSARTLADSAANRMR